MLTRGPIQLHFAAPLCFPQHVFLLVATRWLQVALRAKYFLIHIQKEMSLKSFLRRVKSFSWEFSRKYIFDWLELGHMFLPSRGDGGGWDLRLVLNLSKSVLGIGCEVSAPAGTRCVKKVGHLSGYQVTESEGPDGKCSKKPYFLKRERLHFPFSSLGGSGLGGSVLGWGPEERKHRVGQHVVQPWGWRDKKAHLCPPSLPG